MATFKVNIFGTVNPGDLSVTPDEFTLHVLQVECDDPAVNNSNFHMFIEFYAFPWTINAADLSNSDILNIPQAHTPTPVTNRITNQKPQVIYINKLQPNVPVLLYNMGTEPSLPLYPGTDGSDFRLYSGIYKADIGNPLNTNIDTTTDSTYYLLPVTINIIANGCRYQSDENAVIRINFDYYGNRIIGGRLIDGVPLGFFDKITISNNITQSNISFTNCTLTTAEIVLGAVNGTPPYTYFDSNTFAPITNGQTFPLNSSIDITIVDSTGCEFYDTVIANCNADCDTYVFAPYVQVYDTYGNIVAYNLGFNGVIYDQDGNNIPTSFFSTATITVNSITNGTVVVSNVSPVPVTLPINSSSLFSGRLFVQYLDPLNKVSTVNFTVNLETSTGCVYTKTYSITFDGNQLSTFFNTGILNLQ